MKLLTHPASTAFGLAVLCCLVLIAPITSLDHLIVFHDSGPPSSIFLPLLFDLAIVWLLITLVPVSYTHLDVYKRQCPGTPA